MIDTKILIVEDEQIIAENLRFILNEYGYSFVDVAMDKDEAIHLFEKNNYDLVLMDVNLGMASSSDGIDLIKELKKKYSFIFIYVTANADTNTVEKAKETNPAGYIVKPFVNSSIYANVEIALNTFKKEEYFTYIHKGMQQQILLSNVTYIKADGSYIHIYMDDKSKHFVRKSIAEFGEAHQNNFIRIHKSLLVNLDHVQAYTSRVVQIDEEKLSLGRTYKKNFLLAMKQKKG